MNLCDKLKDILPSFVYVQSTFVGGTFSELTVFKLCYRVLGKFESEERSKDCVTNNNTTARHALFMIGALKDKLYEVINTGHWSLVATKHRQTFTLATYLEVLLHFFISNTDRPADTTIYDLDYGLIMGCPLDEPYNSLLSDAIEFLNDIKIQPQSSSKRQKLDCAHRTETETCDIPILSRPPILQFQRDHFLKSKPVLLTDCMQHWPAMKKWGQAGYLTTMAGNRTVPIEVGAHYTTDEWSQDLVRFEEFIERQITREAACDRIEYLAQHNLFDQVPALRQDILVPEYCCCTETSGPSEPQPDIKAWLGPKGTVSPMHHDPKHNLLCQVFGHKEIILAAPSDSANLYPHIDAMLQNTSQVNAEHLDFEAFPLAERVRFYRFTLYTGEMLYLPPGWWHHIRSLDKSFSVSFWWD